MMEMVSNEYQINASFTGSLLKKLPVFRIFANEKTELFTRFNLYQRRTESPDWYSKKKDLLAFIFSVGIRYRFD